MLVIFYINLWHVDLTTWQAQILVYVIYNLLSVYSYMFLLGYCGFPSRCHIAILELILFRTFIQEYILQIV